MYILTSCASLVSVWRSRLLHDWRGLYEWQKVLKGLGRSLFFTLEECVLIREKQHTQSLDEGARKREVYWSEGPPSILIA